MINTSMKVFEIAPKQKKPAGPTSWKKKSASKIGKSKITKTLSDFEYNLNELTSSEKLFWTKYYEHNQEFCIKALTFLSSLNDKHLSLGVSAPSIPVNALKDLRKFSGVSNFRFIHRGIEIDSEQYNVGDKFSHESRGLSFWTPDKEWADAFINWGGEGILLQKPFRKSDVLLDMHNVPFAIGPSREDELLLMPGQYNTKIIKKY